MRTTTSRWPRVGQFWKVAFNRSVSTPKRVHFSSPLCFAQAIWTPKELNPIRPPDRA